MVTDIINYYRLFIAAGSYFLDLKILDRLSRQAPGHRFRSVIKCEKILLTLVGETGILRLTCIPTVPKGTDPSSLNRTRHLGSRARRADSLTVSFLGNEEDGVPPKPPQKGQRPVFRPYRVTTKAIVTVKTATMFFLSGEVEKGGEPDQGVERPPPRGRDR